MRNILLILTLCVVSLTSSRSVFAEIYDDSKRTERMGLSYYDGRPMYFLSVARPLDRPHYPLYLEATRVHTGEDISDYPNYHKGTGYVIIEGATSKDFVIYGYDKDGNLEYLSGAGDPDNSGWMQEALRLYGPSAIAEASLTGGDVAVDIFDVMLEPLSEMLRGWLGVVLAIGAVMFGWNFVRELSTLDFSGKSKGKNSKASTSLSYANLSRRERSFYEDAALGSIGIESSQLLVPKEIKKDVDFVTGAAFGLKFDEKTRESNRLLMEMFNRLSSKEQKAILKAFRESAFDKSFEDSAEKRFLAYQGEVFDDVDNPFTGRSKRRAFDPLDAEVLSQGYGSEYVGWDVVSSADEIDDANASLDEAYYDDNGGTPF